MTRISMKTMIAAAVIATAAGLALAGQSGSAGAKGVSSCDGPDKSSLRECCETKVMKKGLPLWMRQTGKNCATAAAKCVSSNAITHVETRCYYVIGERDRDDRKMNENDHSDRGSDTRPQ